MWINKNISEKIKKNKPAVYGQVISSDKTKVNIQADSQCRELPVVAPCGIAWVPKQGDAAVVLPLDGGRVCIGGAVPDKGLEPGEIMLYSSGGATLTLKNDGKILANGREL